MWQACIFLTCNCFKTRIEWKINSLNRRKKNRDILRYKFRIAIRFKFFVYCDIPIYRYIETPLLYTHWLTILYTCERPCHQAWWFSFPPARTDRNRCRSRQSHTGLCRPDVPLVDTCSLGYSPLRSCCLGIQDLDMFPRRQWRFHDIPYQRRRIWWNVLQCTQIP